MTFGITSLMRCVDLTGKDLRNQDDTNNSTGGAVEYRKNIAIRSRIKVQRGFVLVPKVPGIRSEGPPKPQRHPRDVSEAS